MTYEKVLIPSYDEIMTEFKDTLGTHGLNFGGHSSQLAIESAAANSE